MAGAGYKLFNTGDVLTAAQVNTYLQEQAVMRFASAAARTTALSGVLAEGMVSYLMDTNAVEVYDGSAWVGVATGDITAVTAGTGISGGGTSGAVTITNSMATEITAAGDIIVGTGSGTFDNLPIGTTGQVLTADTTVSPYKVKWASPAGGGKVLQVIQDTLVGLAQTTSTTYADTGLTVSITPSSASSKVLVMANVLGVAKVTGSSGARVKLKLLRDSTSLMNHERAAFTNSDLFNDVGSVDFNYLDSPATTSAITYKVQYASGVSGQTVYLNDYASTDDMTSTIIVMEIGA